MTCEGAFEGTSMLSLAPPLDRGGSVSNKVLNAGLLLEYSFRNLRMLILSSSVGQRSNIIL